MFKVALVALLGMVGADAQRYTSETGLEVRLTYTKKHKTRLEVEIVTNRARYRPFMEKNQLPVMLLSRDGKEAVRVTSVIETTIEKEDGTVQSCAVFRFPAIDGNPQKEWELMLPKKIYGEPYEGPDAFIRLPVK